MSFTVPELQNLAACARIALASGAQQFPDEKLVEIAALPAKCGAEIKLIQTVAPDKEPAGDDAVAYEAPRKKKPIRFPAPEAVPVDSDGHE